MPKTKEQKQKTIEDLKQNLVKTKSMVFVDIHGLKVKDLVNLRKKAKQAMGNLKVAKKSLIDLALGKNDLNVKKMPGEIAVLLAFEDPIAPLKSFYEFSKENENLKFVSGVVEGALFGQEEIISLAQLPSRQALLSRLVASINSPVSGFVNVLRGNLKNFVFVLSQLKSNAS